MLERLQNRFLAANQFIRGIRDRLLFYAIQRWGFTYATLSLIASSYLHPNYSFLAILSGILAVAWEAWKIFIVHLSINIRLARPTIEHLLTQSILPFGSKLIDLGTNCTIIASQDTNELLKNTRTPVHIDSQLYRPPLFLSRYWGEILSGYSRGTSNDDKVRLSSDFLPGSPAKLQKTNYFSGLLTNELAKSEIVQSEGYGEEVVFRGRDFLIGSDRVFRLSESLASNHIGVSTFLITADRELIYQRQGLNAVDTHLFTSSVAGSADWSDVGATSGASTIVALVTDYRWYQTLFGVRASTTRSLEDIVRAAVHRELSEELSIGLHEPNRIATHLTGYARFPRRAGKPEFFTLTLATQSKADLAPRGGEYVKNIESVQLESMSSKGAITALGELWQRHPPDSGVAGPTFYAGIYFARALLELSPVDIIESFYSSVPT